MQGDVILINGVLREVVEETIVTIYPEEKHQTMLKRVRAGKAGPVVRFTAVRTRPILELPDSWNRKKR